MKLCHAAALALVGCWWLLAPPLGSIDPKDCHEIHPPGSIFHPPSPFTGDWASFGFDDSLRECMETQKRLRKVLLPKNADPGEHCLLKLSFCFEDRCPD